MCVAWRHIIFMRGWIMHPFTPPIRARWFHLWPIFLLLFGFLGAQAHWPQAFIYTISCSTITRSASTKISIVFNIFDFGRVNRRPPKKVLKLQAWCPDIDVGSTNLRGDLRLGQLFLRSKCTSVLIPGKGTPAVFAVGSCGLPLLTRSRPHIRRQKLDSTCHSTWSVRDT